MSKTIGIRREDKNEWERRVPLAPDDLGRLIKDQGLSFIVQPSPIRAFANESYQQSGALLSEDLSAADIILAVKEIPIELLLPQKTYLFFSHTIKGQDYNMPMLKKLQQLGCNLIDYERIVNEKNQRLLFFGRFAGMAGMIDTLAAYGKKMALAGCSSPFEKIRPAYQYDSVEQAKAEIAAIGDEISANGLPLELCPLIVGFAGYGNVSRGAQEIFDLLPFKTISPAMLSPMAETFAADPYHLYKVVFREEDMAAAPAGQAFDLQDYYDHPEKYQPIFETYLPFLTILVNCIYWTEKYPRLLTRDYLKTRAFTEGNPKPLLIGDISCDINGAIEITHQATKPDQPCFTYHPAQDSFSDGVLAGGNTVMAVDNLPCEFPRESSQEFSQVLHSMIPGLAATDFSQPFTGLDLPQYLKKALILHRGELTPEYRYLEKFL